MATEVRKQKQRDKRKLKRQWRAIDKLLGLKKTSSPFTANHASPKQERVLTRWTQGQGGKSTQAQKEARAKELLRIEQARIFARAMAEANK